MHQRTGVFHGSCGCSCWEPCCSAHILLFVIHEWIQIEWLADWTEMMQHPTKLSVVVIRFAVLLICSQRHSTLCLKMCAIVRVCSEQIKVKEKVSSWPIGWLGYRRRRADVKGRNAVSRSGVYSGRSNRRYDKRTSEWYLLTGISKSIRP